MEIIAASDVFAVDFHCCVIFPCERRENFTRVNIIEVMYKRLLVNGKVDRGSTFTFTRDPPYIACILFTRVKFSAYAPKNYATVEIHP